MGYRLVISLKKLYDDVFAEHILPLRVIQYSNYTLIVGEVNRYLVIGVGRLNTGQRSSVRIERHYFVSVRA